MKINVDHDQSIKIHLHEEAAWSGFSHWPMFENLQSWWVGIVNKWSELGHNRLCLQDDSEPNYVQYKGHNPNRLSCPWCSSICTVKTSLNFSKTAVIQGTESLCKIATAYKVDLMWASWLQYFTYNKSFFNMEITFIWNVKITRAYISPVLL